MKYYIHCNTEQIYSGLIMNSLLSYSNTAEAMRKHTSSFLGNEYICLFVKPQMPDIRSFMADEIYYPVTLEVSLDNVDEDYKVIPFSKNADGTYSLGEKANISSLSKRTDLAGIFVCGELPLGCLCRIMFENEDGIERFQKPSPDLWFPKDLYAIITEECDEGASIEALADVAKVVDATLSEVEIGLIQKTIDNRARSKASMCFAIRETQDFANGDIIANLDDYTIGLLDDAAGSLRSAFEQMIVAEQAKNESNPINVYDVATLDVILSQEGKPEYALDRAVFEIFSKYVMAFEVGNSDLSRDSVDAVKEMIRANLDDETQKAEVEKYFAVISEFLLSSFMNPEEALAKLKGHPVFKAIMKFLDSSDNDMHMKYGCEDLTQFEKRYAYIWFGLLKGMGAVDGAYKSNRELEYRIEQIVCSKHANEHLISSLYDNAPFAAKADEAAIYGIVPTAHTWYGVATAYRMFNENDEMSQTLYAYLMGKKEATLKKKNFDCFEQPIVMTVHCELAKSDLTIVFNTMDEIKKAKNKQLEAYAKKIPTKMQVELFKKEFVSNKNWFNTIFSKHTDVIQQMCRR